MKSLWVIASAIAVCLLLVWGAVTFLTATPEAESFLLADLSDTIVVLALVVVLAGFFLVVELVTCPPDPDPPHFPGPPDRRDPPGPPPPSSDHGPRLAHWVTLWQRPAAKAVASVLPKRTPTAKRD